MATGGDGDGDGKKARVESRAARMCTQTLSSDYRTGGEGVEGDNGD